MKLLQDDGSLQSKGLATPGLQALIIGIRSTFPAKLVLASDLLLKKMIKSGGIAMHWNLVEGLKAPFILFLLGPSCSLFHESFHRSGKELLFLRPS